MGKVPRDDNHVPAFDAAYGFQTTKNMVFDGGTTNDPGDFDGTGNPATLFSVTGAVRMKIFAVCSVDLVGGATVEVGTTTTTAGLIAQTTATDIDSGEIWHDATPDASIEDVSVLTDNIVTEDVIQTVGTANITAGELDYQAQWYPLSPDGNVEAA